MFGTIKADYLVRYFLYPYPHSPDREFPAPPKLLECLPGSYNPAYASTTCLACPRGSYQSAAGQSRCDTCRLGFTTRDMGATNVSGCVPMIPDDFDYPTDMTCDELLAAYATVDDKVLLGDGLCNRGPLNTPNCGYDVRRHEHLECM